MKQNIIKISDIKFTRPIKIKKPVDITQTYIYEDLKRINPAISDNELTKRSHIGFVLAQLLHFYDVMYDVEIITPDDTRYKEAAEEIASYVETDWLIDDADIVQAEQIELADEYYNVKHKTTLYMYFDDWIQFGYEAFISPTDWDAAFHQVIYEYMRQFLTIEVS